MSQSLLFHLDKTPGKYSTIFKLLFFSPTDQYVHLQSPSVFMHYAMDDMIIKAVLHRPYKYFSAAFEELKGNQCDSQVSFSTWFLDRYFTNAADYSLQNPMYLLGSF